MKNRVHSVLFAFLAFLASLLAGCSSYTVIGKVNSPCKTDDGVTPIAGIEVFNISYKLFGVLPISSGDTWKEGSYANRDQWNTTWFEDKATIDENLASVRHALKEIGSNKVVNLVNDTDSWSFWSCFFVKRTVVKTTCTVVK